MPAEAVLVELTPAQKIEEAVKTAQGHTDIKDKIRSKLYYDKT